MPKYVGQSNAYDIPNNIIYMGDLLYAWDVGDDLTGWVLSGNTNPTIAVDGRIRLYDATGGGGTSAGYFELPNTKGAFLGIVNIKFTRMLDDTSVHQFMFALQFSAHPVVTGGICINFNSIGGTVELRWINSNYQGVVSSVVGVAPVAGTEYALSIVMGPNKIIFLLNGAKIGEILIGNTGGACPLSATQLRDHFAQNKKVHLYASHAGGQVSHIRVRDIRVSRYVGQS